MTILPMITHAINDTTALKIMSSVVTGRPAGRKNSLSFPGPKIRRTSPFGGGWLVTKSIEQY
jgi:hypothetical protein